MPITLEKLLSPTAETSFSFMGETVTVVYAPMRYTGEMQAFAERMSDESTAEQEAIADLRLQAAQTLADAGTSKAEKDGAKAAAAELLARADERSLRLDLRDRKTLRDSLSSDGDGKGGPPGMLVSWDVMEGRKPLKPDRRTLDRLPDIFLKIVFAALASENQPDPTKAPTSSES